MNVCLLIEALYLSCLPVMIGGGLGISWVSLSPGVGPPCVYHQSRNCRKKLPTSRLKVRILAVVLTEVMARWVRPWLSKRKKSKIISGNQKLYLE